jgi:hypothetical protein
MAAGSTDGAGGVPTPPATGTRRLPRYLVAPAIALTLAGLTAGSLFAAASFTDSTSTGDSSFSTGTVRISATPATTALTMGGMLAGDRLTTRLTVANSGSLRLRYAITSVISEGILAAKLVMTVKAGVSTCTNAGFDADGSVLYGLGAAGSAQGLAILGDPATGAQAGDRTIGPGVQEVLCVQVALPVSADNTAQGRSTTVTSRFSAEQAG